MVPKDISAGVNALKPAKRRNVVEPRGYSPEVPEGAVRLAQLLGAETRRNRFGEHLSLRRWFPDPSAYLTSLETLRLLSPGAPPEAADPFDWLFLDTETTGLAGGTGTYAFLVGMAWWDTGGLEVEQLFMREHSEEHSLLAALADRLAEKPVLVTFNGKAFDWPLLETRFRMTRAISPRAPCAHFDMLHPARQLWRLSLNSLRLAELEKHILGIERGVDVDSSLIPQMYFEFVRGGSADPLLLVFRHNQMDLRGLATLSDRVLSLLAAPESSRNSSLELYGVSRLLDRRGELSRARSSYLRALAGGLPLPVQTRVQERLAQLAKRNKDFSAANSFWKRLWLETGDTEEAIRAAVELAIHCEHRAKDPECALEITRRALARLRKTRASGAFSESRCHKIQADLERRQARLIKKISHTDRGHLLKEFHSESNE